MNVFHNLASESEIHALHRSAWEARFRDPSKIDPIADRIIGETTVESVAQAWGYWHRAVSFRFKRDIIAMHATLATAEAVFRAHAEASGIAMCREQLARQRVNEGDEVAARSLAAEATPASRNALGVWERFALCDLDVAIATRFSTPETTIRLLSRAIIAARETNDAAVIAQTLSMLAGKHAELNNYETALANGREAFELASAFKPGTAWYISALNLLLIYNGMRNATAALSVAEELMPFDEQIFLPIREQSNLLYARAHLLNGDLPKAQTLLDRSRKLAPTQTQSYAWSDAQAALFHAEGKFQRAKELCTEIIRDVAPEKMMLSPSVAVRTFRTAARSAEALGDTVAALDYERRAVAYVEVEFGRAALARRVALEVEFDLDRERAARDDADRKRAESEAERARLDELNHKLDAALQTRTRFLAAASHDLRQPAHALALYAAALEHETSRPALVDLSKRMRATVGSLSNMFDGLLELARLDAGAVQPQPDVFDLQELLSRLCSEYGDRLSRPSLLLKFRRRSSDVFLQSDATLVERILRNLIGNAVKYAGNGNILVAVRKRGGGVAIEVRDAGPGISTSEQRHVFDEFFRAASASDRRDGLGLGLSIVERFTRLLGMEISLRSAPGRGSTFSLIVPGAMLGARPLVTVDSGLQRAALESRHIAVIDDDSDARESMALLLRQWGHVCVTGASAAALQTESEQQRFSPDALICDFQLDGRTALDDIAALRRMFGDGLPVLVVSGSHDAQASVEARFADVAFLSKPVRPLRLKSWISSLSSDA
ncbi:MAG: response regulator [Betaproteobacteria bacterium]|nr:MAG: response regulator [Betaproteobacteria bacterium]